MDSLVFPLIPLYPRGMAKQQRTVLLDPDLVAWLDSEASRRRRSVSFIINDAVERARAINVASTGPIAFEPAPSASSKVDEPGSKPLERKIVEPRFKP